MFDFEKALKDAKKDLDNHLLRALVLGPSGSGKSTLLGTFGCRTLYLYTTGESHGPVAASSNGADIIPVCIDRDGDTVLAADESYNRLLTILGSGDQIKKMGVGAIAIDGATELETIIRQTTKWRKACETDKGKHNGFAEPAATLMMFRAVLDALRKLQLDLGIHYAMTCILDVKELADNGEILESTPRLTGYSVAEGLCQQLEYFAVGRMTKGDKVSHRIQFMAGVTKASKDQVGRIKKTLNFNPRLFGVNTPPATLDADLSKVIDLKAKRSAV